MDGDEIKVLGISIVISAIIIVITFLLAFFGVTDYKTAWSVFSVTCAAVSFIGILCAAIDDWDSIALWVFIILTGFFSCFATFTIGGIQPGVSALTIESGAFFVYLACFCYAEKDDNMWIWLFGLLGGFCIFFAICWMLGVIIAGLQIVIGFVILAVPTIILIWLVKNWDEEDKSKIVKFVVLILLMFPITFSIVFLSNGFDYFTGFLFAGGLMALSAGVLSLIGMIFFKDDLPDRGLFALPIAGFSITVLLMAFLSSSFSYGNVLQIIGGILTLGAGGLAVTGVYYYKDNLILNARRLLAVLGVFGISYSIGYFAAGYDFTFSLLLGVCAVIISIGFIIGVKYFRRQKNMNVTDKLAASLRRKAKERIIPIVGPSGSGKTWFICALDLWLNKKITQETKAYFVLNKEGRNYLDEMQGKILNRTTVPTEQKHSVELWIDPVKINLNLDPKQFRKKGLILKSGDISGISFEELKPDFMACVASTEILVILIDKNHLQGEKAGERLSQVSHSIEAALESKKLKAILFIITKNDSGVAHLEKIKEQFDQTFTTVLGRLKMLGITFAITDCSALGEAHIDKPEPLQPQGFDTILKLIAEMSILKK